MLEMSLARSEACLKHLWRMRPTPYLSLIVEAEMTWAFVLDVAVPIVVSASALIGIGIGIGEVRALRREMGGNSLLTRVLSADFSAYGPPARRH